MGQERKKITWVFRCAATCIPNARPQNRNVSITINLFSFQSTRREFRKFTKAPGCPFLSGGCVNKEGVDAKEEDKVASSQVLEALKQQVLHLDKLS